MTALLRINYLSNLLCLLQNTPVNLYGFDLNHCETSPYGLTLRDN